MSFTDIYKGHTIVPDQFVTEVQKNNRVCVTRKKY